MSGFPQAAGRDLMAPFDGPAGRLPAPLAARPSRCRIA